MEQKLRSVKIKETFPFDTLLCFYVCMNFIFLLFSACFLLFSGCHSSCRVCVGPDSSDCMQCVKQEEVLLSQNGHVSHGSCMSACRSKHYLDSDRTCRGEQTRRRILIFFFLKMWTHTLATIIILSSSLIMK